MKNVGMMPLAMPEIVRVLSGRSISRPEADSVAGARHLRRTLFPLLRYSARNFIYAVISYQNHSCVGHAIACRFFSRTQVYVRPRGTRHADSVPYPFNSLPDWGNNGLTA